MKNFLLYFFLLLALLHTKAQAQDYERLHQQAISVYDKNDFKGADSLFQELLNVLPKDSAYDSLRAYTCHRLGYANMTLGRCDKGEYWYSLSMEIKEKLPKGKLRPDYTQSCFSLASTLQRCGKLEKAENYYKIALALREQNPGKQSLAYARTATSLGQLYKEMGKFDKSEPYLREAIGIFRSVGGPQHRDFATSKLNLIDMLAEKADFASALKETHSLLFELQNAKVKDSVVYANIYGRLGNVFIDRQLYDSAQIYIKQSKWLLGKHLGKNSREFAFACNNLGILYTETGQLALASKEFEEAQTVLLSLYGMDHPEYISNCNNRANLYLSEGYYDKAEELYLIALNGYAKLYGKESSDYAIACGNIGGVYIKKGLFHLAEEYFLTAQRLRKKFSGELHPDYLSACSNLGNLYFYQGLFEKAYPLNMEVLESRKKVLGEESFGYASACNNLAGLLKRMGRKQEAYDLHLKARAIFSKIIGKDHTEYASACSNLGLISLELGKTEEARLYQEEALAIFEKTVGKEHPDYANACNNLGIYYNRMHDIAKAEKYYLEALEVRKRSQGTEHPDFAGACSNLGMMYAENGRIKEAWPLLQTALESKVKLVQTVFPTLAEDQRQDFYLDAFKTFQHIFGYIAFAANENPSLAQQAFDLSLFYKGLVFYSSKQIRDQIMASNDSILIADFNEWKRLKSLKSQAINMTQGQKAKSNINFSDLDNTIEEMEKKLSKRSASFSKNVLIARNSWKELHQKLQPNEALVELVRIGAIDAYGNKGMYLALVLCKDWKEPKLLAIHNGTFLENNQINYYQDCLLLQKKDQLSYSLFWKPIDSLLATCPSKIKKVFLSSDGVYHQLNAEALYDTQKSEYVFDKYKIHVLSSSKDLLNPQSTWKLSSNTSCVLMGAPTFTGLSAASSAEKKYSEIQSILGEGLYWPELPGSLVEVSNIRQLIAELGIKASLYTEAQATESAFKAASSANIIHIATHGYFLQSFTKEVKNLQDAHLKKFLSKPYVRSGLVLAGASDPKSEQEDGILTAEEVANLSLENTELVVLSACETGLGDIQYGEGVFGLQRAFQQAGAKTILMSLWRVSDEATELLMSNFYQQLAKGKSKREAFRSAQMLLRKRYPHPYFWAAFVMLGP